MQEEPARVAFPSLALPPQRRSLAGDVFVVLAVVLLVAAALALLWFARPIVVWLLAGGSLHSRSTRWSSGSGAGSMSARFRITVASVLVALGIAARAFVFVPLTGVVGALLAIPIAASTKIVVEDVRRHRSARMQT